MARQTVRTSTTTRTRVKKNGEVNDDGYMVCNVCGGSGVQKKPYSNTKKTSKKKKKKKQ